MLWRNESVVSVEYWKVRLQFEDIKIEERVEPWKSLRAEKERVFLKHKISKFKKIIWERRSKM